MKAGEGQTILKRTQAVLEKMQRVEVLNMQMNKSISGKLYMGFGLIIVIVVFAFVVNWVAVAYESSTRKLYKDSISMVENLSRLDKMRSENRLYLRNFLLNG